MGELEFGDVAKLLSKNDFSMVKMALSSQYRLNRARTTLSDNFNSEREQIIKNFEK